MPFGEGIGVRQIFLLEFEVPLHFVAVDVLGVLFAVLVFDEGIDLLEGGDAPAFEPLEELN